VRKREEDAGVAVHPAEEHTSGFGIATVDLSKRVVVVGGGDTAIDYCTALRCGAREVVLHLSPGSGRDACTPHEFVNALEEGGKFLFQTEPVEVLSNLDGHVKAPGLPALFLVPKTRRPHLFIPQPGEEFDFEADCHIGILILLVRTRALPAN
jgi:NADPH-dependent glutamate synthase beta subunit-like oxidoreductase